MYHAQVILDTLIHYVDQVEALLTKIEQHPDCDALLMMRAAPDVFPVGQQMAIAVHFAARAVAPVTGRVLPQFPDDPTPQVLRCLV